MSNTFSARIKELRKKNNLTQEEFGERFNITKTGVSYWESGKSEPSLEMIIKISKRFSVSVAYLLGLDGVNYQENPGNENTNPQSNNNTGTINNTTNNYGACKPDTVVYSDDVSLLFAIIDGLKALDKEKAKKVLEYIELLGK